MELGNGVGGMFGKIIDEVAVAFLFVHWLISSLVSTTLPAVNYRTIILNNADIFNALYQLYAITVNSANEN